jgi:hypothetical protein
MRIHCRFTKYESPFILLDKINAVKKVLCKAFANILLSQRLEVSMATNSGYPSNNSLMMERFAKTFDLCSGLMRLIVKKIL